MLIYWDKELEQKLMSASRAYYQLTDEAHHLHHIIEVKDRAISMANWCKGNIGYDNINLNALLIAVVLHDMGGAIDRENHARESVKLLLTEPRFTNLNLDKEDVQIACTCILEHSSHFSGKYSSIESEILASADRDRPETIPILIRSMRYSIKHCDSAEETISGCVKYNMKRYSTISSSDYHVPTWHYQYWDSECPNLFEELRLAFSNDSNCITQICTLIYDMIADGGRADEELLNDVLHHNIHNESKKAELESILEKYIKGALNSKRTLHSESFRPNICSAEDTKNILKGWLTSGRNR